MDGAGRCGVCRLHEHRQEEPQMAALGIVRGASKVNAEVELRYLPRVPTGGERKLAISSVEESNNLGPAPERWTD